MSYSFRFTSLMLFLMFSLCIHPQDVCAQSKKFNFGVQLSGLLTQIEGDNLRGFSYPSFGFGLLGGYNFTPNAELLVAGSYELIGSQKGDETPSNITNKALAEVKVKQVSLFMAYAKRFGDDWDGSYNFRYHAGIKFNNILKEDGKLFTAIIEDNPQFNKSDFKNKYFSLRIGIGLYVSNHFIVDIFYEHSLQNILAVERVNTISKLVPFYLGLNLSYYL